MFPYRELAGDRKFRCARCGGVKRVKYVPISNLCRRCAARRAAEKRRSVPNIPITLADNLVVTRAVERRLKKKAEGDIPPTRAEKLGDHISRWSILVFWASAYFVAHAIFPESFGLFWWVLVGFIYNDSIFKYSCQRSNLHLFKIYISTSLHKGCRSATPY